MRYFVFFVCSICLASAQASDGAFDTTFADGGRETFNLSASKLDVPLAAAEQPDGRLVLVGGCGEVGCLVRLKVDGSLDTSFGPFQLGSALLDQFAGAPTRSLVKDVLVLADGRIVLPGCFETNTDAIYVVRADGTGFDTSVGNGNGYLVGTQGTAQFYDCAIRVRRQSDGKFLVLQEVTDSSYGKYMLVTRVAADLSGLDASFGTAGVAKIAFAITGVSGNVDQPTSLALQDDGKIVVGGYSAPGGQNEMEFARLLSNGQLDDSFGGSGTGRVHFNGGVGTNLRAMDIALTPDQRIVFGGSYDNGSDTYVEMIGRLTSAGAYDPAFSGGLVLYSTPLGTAGSQIVERVAVSAGTVIATSRIPRTDSSGDSYFEVSQFSWSGIKVPTFGGGGTTYASFAANDTDSRPTTSIVTRHGIVVAGSTINSGLLQFGVARLQFDHIFENAFN